MTLTDLLDRVAAFEPAPYPEMSLYLNTEPGQTGRDQFQTFVRKEFAGRSRTYSPGSRERDLLERDLAAISEYLETELQPSTNRVALFACSGLRFGRIGPAGCSVRRALDVDRRPTSPVPTGSCRVGVPALRGRACGHQLRTDPGHRDGRSRRRPRGDRSQNAPDGPGRLVAGSINGTSRTSTCITPRKSSKRSLGSYSRRASSTSCSPATK